MSRDGVDWESESEYVKSLDRPTINPHTVETLDTAYWRGYNEGYSDASARELKKSPCSQRGQATSVGSMPSHKRTSSV